MRQTDLRRGAAYAVAAAASFAAMGAAVKLAADELETEMVVFLRTSFGLLVLGPILLRYGWRHLKTNRLPMHITRSAVGLSAMYCFFFAIPRLNLADAVLLNYSQPLFIPFIAWWWVKERPSPPIFPAVVIGFIGVAFIIKPDLGFINPAGLIGLGAGVLAAVAMVAIRRMADTEPTTRIVFYFSLTGTLLSAIPLLWAWQTPSNYALACMIAAGGLATLGQLLLTRAYAMAPAAEVGSLIYAAVIFAGLFGWLLWDEQPDAYSALGTLLVIGAGIIAIRQRSRRTASP